MKINCGPTKAEKKFAEHERLKNWHRFFALWPRRVGPGDCRCLEWIERKGYWDSWDKKFSSWEYRPISSRSQPQASTEAKDAPHQTPKLCRDCKFFSVGRCLHETSAIPSHDLVHGYKTYSRAHIQRATYAACGPEGKFHEEYKWIKWLALSIKPAILITGLVLLYIAIK